MFRNMRGDRSITVDRVVRGYLAPWNCKMLNHFIESIQDRRMKDDRIHGHSGRPFVAIWGCMDDLKDAPNFS